MAFDAVETVPALKHNQNLTCERYQKSVKLN